MSSNANAIGVGLGGWRALVRGAQRRPRMVLQTESAECGLACLAMIANFHGFDIDLVSLRQRHPGSSRGVDLNGLIDVAAELNLTARALKAEVHELRDVQLPCILHWGTNHFVVLSAIHAHGFEILDPAGGTRRISTREFDRHFSGVVLELVPAASFRKAQLRRRLRLQDLWTRANGLRRSLAQVLLLSLLLQLLVIGAPLYTQLVLDAVVIDGQWGLLRPIAFGFALLVLLQASITLLRSYAILHLSNRLSVHMAANLFHHLIRLPLSYFLKRHLGDVLSRFQSLQQVRQMMTTGIVSAWLDGFMVVVTMVVMFYYSALLTFVVLAIVVAYVMLRVAAFQKLKQLKQEQLVASANESTHFMETLRAIQTLKVFQKEADRQSQWVNRLTALVNKDTHIAKWDAFFVAANTAFFGLENILVVYLCVRLVEQQQFSLGMLFAFVNFKVNFTRSIGALINQCADFLMLKIHFERISDIAFAKQEAHHMRAEEQASHAVPRKLGGAIEVRNVGFQFEGSKRFVFRDLSFSVGAGETLAIVGPSGSGKTTLLKCLLGLVEPTEGEILIDGVNLQSMPGYRKQIAAVMQDDQLISGSIRDNIAFFEKSPSMQRIVECASMACIHQEILSMPMRYDTLVGDLGSNLSGGQKQRVILARALYRSPRILFMDEATSHLDVAAEASVNQQIGQLAITRVLVAHRPETVRAAGKRISIADVSSPCEKALQL